MKKVNEKNRRRLKRKARIRKDISGTKKCPRMSVFRSNKNISVQVINDEKGETLLSASTLEGDMKNTKRNKEGAKAVGKLIGQRLKKKRIKTVVFDRNGYKYHGQIKELADAAREEGIQF